MSARIGPSHVGPASHVKHVEHLEHPGPTVPVMGLAPPVARRSSPNLALDLLDTTGRPVVVQLRVRSDAVELCCEGRCLGQLARQTLGTWLRAPDGALAHGDGVWRWTGDHVALGVPGLVPARELGHHVLAILRMYV